MTITLMRDPRQTTRDGRWLLIVKGESTAQHVPVEAPLADPDDALLRALRMLGPLAADLCWDRLPNGNFRAEVVA